MTASLTIIIPTVCTQARRESLFRAIDSAFSSADRNTLTVVVVANGLGVSEEVLDQIKIIPNVQTLRLEEGSLPKALIAGRKAVKTEFFSFLDDDDELLPDASRHRLEKITKNEEADLVVINGWRQTDNGRQPMHPNIEEVPIDPLRALLKQNWLASCAAIFRTESVGVEFFEDPQPYAEWTWLAFRLCRSKRNVVVIDQPGYVINDTPNSLSKSANYLLAYTSLFDRIEADQPPDWIVSIIARKRSATMHELATRSLSEGKIFDAWRFHLLSIKPLQYGLRHLFFTRKLLYALIKTRIH